MFFSQSAGNQFADPEMLVRLNVTLFTFDKNYITNKNVPSILASD